MLLTALISDFAVDGIACNDAPARFPTLFRSDRMVDALMICPLAGAVH